METSFNVVLPMQDGTIFKHCYSTSASELIELILVHIIALQHPAVLIDHYVRCVDVSIRNVQVPVFTSLSLDELSEINESINGHISNLHQTGLHKQFEILLSCRRLLKNSDVIVDIGVSLNKFNLRAKYANCDIALRKWGSSYIVHRLLKCVETPVDTIHSNIGALYPLPDMPYSMFKKLFNGG